MLCVCAFVGTMIAASSGPLGELQHETDVGGPLRPGSAHYDASRDEYRITGGGDNMWGPTDGFHYVYRQASGDLTLTASVRFPQLRRERAQEGGLDGSAAAHPQLALRGRGAACERTRQPPISAHGGRRDAGNPVQDQHAGNHSAWSAWGTPSRSGRRVPAGRWNWRGRVEVPLHDPVYVGLAVCSHDAGVLEEAVISKPSLLEFKEEEERDQPVESRLETISVEGAERRVVYRAEKRFEAPNWSRDGKYLLFNSGGRLYTLPVEGGEPRLLNTGEATRCNNDHGFSPDGQWLAISNSPGGDSMIYVLPAVGRPAAPRDRARALLLAWLVSGWQDARLLRRAGRQLRYLHHSRRGRRRTPLDGCPRLGRRPRLFPRWPVDLLQLRAHAAGCRSGACTRMEPGRSR